jgi:hypothetical protein
MKNTLICMRADYPGPTVRGSSYDRVCSACQARVQISPAGQRELKADPKIEILCEPCFHARQPQPGDRIEYLGEEEPAASELAPNLWRNRN